MAGQMHGLFNCVLLFLRYLLARLMYNDFGLKGTQRQYRKVKLPKKPGSNHVINALKSVHFKKPVTRISFLSKVLSFSIQHQLNQNKVILKMTTILKEMRIAQLSS